MALSVIHRLRYIQKFKDRHGKVRLYLRRKGIRPIALPDETDPGFLQAYATALAATAPMPKTDRVDPRSFEALTRSYVASGAFKGLGTTTARVYERIIKALVVDHGSKPVPLLDRRGIQKIIDAKSDTPAAANHVLRTLRALCKYAVKLDLMKSDPTVGIDRLKEVGEGAETWTENDIAKFEAHFPIGSRPRLAFALLLYTGQRRSDVVRMGRQHIRDGAIEVRQVKTKARLFIPLHPDLQLILEGETDRLTFLVTGRGIPFTSNGFYNVFKEWCGEAGMPIDRSPHGLRKAAARRMAEGGCTAHQIAAITGDRSLSEVQRYTQAADQIKLAQAAVLSLGRPSNVSNLETAKVSNRRKN